MGGNTKETSEEIDIVVRTLLDNEALTRLAENPLLLTMLLVVKHGYGRLPPDRVSLYERAVEVLLDTWNIKGHDALNPREGVPQLAYIAFRLMQQRQQTATERELLQLVETCRQRVPLVQLYAKDAPSEFLKRVELRSSLLLEAGRVADGGRTVAFYQFRHLTFQEYLAAVAVVEGHYDNYEQGESILIPLGDSLIAEEWKEVIPMAAVLAKKQADPLLAELNRLGAAVESVFFSTGHESGAYEWTTAYRMPAPVARLTQCLIEEAEFSQSSLDDALRLVATFAHGCQGPENWGALGRGPFGEALYQRAWQLFQTGSLPKEAWIRNTVALLAAHRRVRDDWLREDSIMELQAALQGQDPGTKAWAAAAVCGLIWLYPGDAAPILLPLQESLEANLAADEAPVWELTGWAIGLLQENSTDQDSRVILRDHSLDILARKWLAEAQEEDQEFAAFVLSAALLFPRGGWKPRLTTKDEEVLVRRMKIDARPNYYEHQKDIEAAALLSYHHSGIVADEAIERAFANSRTYLGSTAFETILEDIGSSLQRINEIRSRRPDGEIHLVD